MGECKSKCSLDSDRLHNKTEPLSVMKTLCLAKSICNKLYFVLLKGNIYIILGSKDLLATITYVVQEKEPESRFYFSRVLDIHLPWPFSS